jgi:hypothetical protein
MKTFSKRSLLFGGIILAPIIGLAVGKLWCRANALPRSLTSTLQLLAALNPPLDAAKVLGDIYLSKTKETAAASVRRLEGNKQIQRACASGCPIAIRAAIDEACRADFVSGRTYFIDGWVMGQIELDVAVLCSALS